ncbi:nucleosome-remodeling factor subunit BPTF-like isoform X2 [Lineus longissimus]|uniref:nucleosome-remodeling factor subunit BPTF-like isoform X2 n=1 Tax=Lineus longissimus TaxID=88925 RepID=UPI00315D9B5D
MSMRPRRTRTSRGRPPKSEPTSRSSTFLVKKPKFYEASENSNDSSQFEVPTGSVPGTPSSRSSSRAERKGRDAAQRSRSFMQRVLQNNRAEHFDDDDHDDDDPRSEVLYRNYPYSGDEAGSDIETPSASILGERESDLPFDDNGSDSEFSVESYSTMNSTSRRRYFALQRPEFDVDEEEIPPLVLPTSSTDLILPSEKLLPAMGVYEVLRHFRTILRLSPFRFEDFCAALISDEQCCLLSEIHISLMRALLREEDGNNTTFGPHDLKDSINISFLFLDGMTWPELVRMYLDSDKSLEFEIALKAIHDSRADHPYTSPAAKLTVIQTLTDLFLSTNSVREEIMNEGNIQYDDHCRCCHKLGDLLCCETCPAVYHLTCVDPPLEEVPEDDWLCNVCKAHQLEGVTDCVSELEKSGMMCRQEPLGFDRHGRKYWFLSRRIFVEGENEVWYYSSKYQFEELMETLDGEKWEFILVKAIEDVKEDIMKQMDMTEKLTNEARGTTPSILDTESSVVKKIQAERAARRAQEDPEKEKAEGQAALGDGKKDEESRPQNEEGKEDRPKAEEDLKNEKLEEDETNNDKVKKSDERKEEVPKVESPGTDGDAEQTKPEAANSSVGSDEKVVEMELDEAGVQSTAEEKKGGVPEIVTGATLEAAVTTAETTTTTTASESTRESTTVSHLKTGSDTVQNDMEVVETTKTTTTTTTVKVIKASATDAVKTGEEGPEKMDVDEGVKIEGEKDEGDVKEEKVLADEAAGGEKMEVQAEAGSEQTHVVDEQGDGEKMDADAEECNKDANVVVESSSITTNSEVAKDGRRMTTRYRTGSLVPKQFPDSIVSTTASVKMTSKNNIISVKSSNTNTSTTASDESVLVINKNGDITRVTRNKISSSASSTVSTTSVKTELFKLGMEGNYKQYVNQYSTNNLALNKHQHNEDRDKRRYLSHKFSLTPASDFKWNGTVYGNKTYCTATLRLSLTHLESNIPGAFLHPNWSIHQKNWLQAVHSCSSPYDFGMAMTILETSIKPVLFTSVWQDQLGHVKLQRITALDREEMKKRERETRGVPGQTEDYTYVWVKYPRGLKHQVWKQRGEEYRITGNGGWYWVSITRDGQYTPQNSVGLRAVARKLMARKARELEALEKTDKEATDKGTVSMEIDENEGLVKEQEKMDTEEEKVDGEIEKAEGEVDAEKKGSEKKDDIATAATEETEKGPKSREEAEKSVKEDGEESMETKAKKDAKMAKAGGKGAEKEPIAFSLSQISRLYPKVDLVNVSESLQKRDHYPKITKPYSKLDSLLDRRMKQDEWEAKQRRVIESLHTRQAAAKEIIKKHHAEKAKKGEEKEKVTEPEESKTKPEKHYQCYSSSCRNSPEHRPCYSSSCPKKKGDWKRLSDDSEDEMDEVDRQIKMVERGKNGQIDQDASDKESDTRSGSNSPSDNMMDVCGDEGQESDKKKGGEAKNSCDSDEKGPSGSGKGPEYEEVNVLDTPAKVKNDENVSFGEPGQKKVASSLVTLLKKVSSEVVKPKGLEESGQAEDCEDKAGSKVVNPKDSGDMGQSGEPNEAKLGDSDGASCEIKKVCSETGEIETSSESHNKEGNKPGTSSEKAKAEKDAGKWVKGTGSGNKKAETAKKSNPALPLLSEMTYAQAVKHLATLPDHKMAELQSKQPPERKTFEPVQLARFTKPVARRVKNKKGSIPLLQKFVTRGKKRSVFLLEKWDAQRLARKKGHIEASGFNYNCKMNNVNWIYPCPRPTFKTAWRYRTMNLHSYAAAALQLRILWACLRWDDMNVKPPAGGTNTISTESEITTTELLKRRDVGPFGLRAEFLVRKIIVPIGLPQPPKEKKYTPIRSGLRERKRPESPKQTEPSVTEQWIPEERLELWEIKQFGEKVEKQRQAHVDKQLAPKATITLSSAPSAVTTVANLKAQLEEQLKNQRVLAQAKRLNEQMKMATTTAPVVSSPRTITIPVSRPPGTPGGTPIIRRITVQPRQASNPLLKAAVAGTNSPAGVSTSKVVIAPRTRTIQLPGTTITIPPTSTVSLAPKATTTSVTSPAAGASVGSLKTIAPGLQLPVKGTVPLQVRPSNPGVQNLQIIQTTTGQLQVRGLLPGQQLIRLADGRLQLITLPTSQQMVKLQTPASSAQTTPAATQPQPVPVSSISSPPKPIVVPAAIPKPTIQVVSAGQLSQVAPSPVRTTTVTAVSAAQPKLLTVTSLPRMANQLPTQQGPLVITAAQAAPALTSQQPSSLLPSNPRLSASKLLGLQPQQVKAASSAQPVVISQMPAGLVSPVRPTTTVVPMGSPVPNMPAVTTTISPTQSILSSLGILSQATSPPAQSSQVKSIVPTSLPANLGVTTLATAQPRYAVTPQVVQQVVRQALLQNQTPEIQAKLLAMQKRITVPKGSEALAQQQQQLAALKGKEKQFSVQNQYQQQLLLKQQQQQQAQMLENYRKHKAANRDKDEEPKEKKAKKLAMSSEEKQKKVASAKLQTLLYKHKEALKRDILKKRGILEKNMQQEIAFEVIAEHKKLKKKTTSKKRKEEPSTSITKTAATIPSSVPSFSSITDVEPTKKKKQKIISTGTMRPTRENETLYCVCRQPYDDTKFYIGCDLCSNWFHGNCVEITEEQAKFMDSYICDDCKRARDDTSEELYCLCRTPYDESQFYIGCDRCQDWFHGRCVGITKCEADSLDVYICPNCQKSSQSQHHAANRKVLIEKDFEVLRRVVKGMQTHKMAWPFVEPVDPDEVPDYYEIIKEPMDLNTLEKKVINHEYPTLGDFTKDVTRIFDNCRYYNPNDSPFFQCAEVLETHFVQKLKTLKEKIMHSH